MYDGIVNAKNNVTVALLIGVGTNIPKHNKNAVVVPYLGSKQYRSVFTHVERELEPIYIYMCV
jgi:hypothetical protein